jgi:hypothetical protein
LSDGVRGLTVENPINFFLRYVLRGVGFAGDRFVVPDESVQMSFRCRVQVLVDTQQILFVGTFFRSD